MKGFLVLLSLAAPALAGCSKTVTWKEEVQLSDGRVIVVERETLRVPGGDELAHGGSGTVPQERRIRFEFPPGAKRTVEWRTVKRSGMGWPEDPLVLDFETDFPYIIALNSGAGCLYYSKYAFRNGAWVEEPLPDQFEPRKANLFLMSGPQMPDFVNLDDKERKNNSSKYDKRLKTIGPERAICNKNGKSGSAPN